MADRKITALTELTAPVATDVFPIIDVSESANANKNKKIQLTTILRGIPNGSASAPSVGFIDDTGTSGLFRVTDDEIGISCNQTQIASFAAAGLKLGSGTIAAQLHLFSTDTTDQVIIENTDAGADTAPDLVLFRNSASPADNDNLGNLIFRGKDDNSDSVEYASIVAQIADATNSSEDGILDLMSTAAGTLASRIRLKSEFVGIHEADPTFPLHLATADTTSGFCIESSLDSAASSADILLFHRRGSDGAGQDNDLLSSISFQGKNDAGTPEEVIYATLETKIIDASDASEDGQINLKSMVAGTLTTVLTVDSNGATVVGNVVVSGTVDGVDIATRDTLFGGLTSSSGVLTNGVTATTQSASDNSTKVATTAYTDTAISNLVDSSPSTLNTLNELAAALGDDANFSTTVTNSIATKMPLAGGTFTGDVTFTGDSANVVFDKSDNALEFADNAKSVFGAGGDLTLLHDGTDSKITNITGNLIFEAKASETGIKVIPDGSVELYHDNVKKAETLADGLDVFNRVRALGGAASIHFNTDATGANTATRAMFGIASGSNAYLIGSSTNDVVLDTPHRFVVGHASSEIMAIFDPDGAVELYHDAVKRFNTTADAVDVHGHINLGANTDDKRLRFGINNDLQMYHDGSNSYIDNSSGSLYLRPKASEDGIKVIPDGSVELYHDNVKKAETSADGITVTDRVTCAAITISDGQPSIIFEDTGANPDFILQNRDGTFAIRDFTSNVNRFLVNAGNGDVTVTGSVTASTGILFGSDTAAANTLNDYEEGTWTPNFSGLTASNTSNTCFYIKIGDMVTAWFRATMPTSTSTATATIGGLPFTIFNSSGIGIAGGAFSETNAGSDLSMIGNANTDNMFVLECNSSGVAVKTLAQISGKDFRGSITYRVA